MGPREAVERVLNPRETKHPYLEGAAIAAGTLTLAGFAISGWLHRPIHAGVKYKESVKRVFRKVNFFSTGMPQTDWVTHLPHHEYPDHYDEEAHLDWNENRPDGAPEAPVEAFRDPYSVVLEGYMRVKFNTSGLHRKAKKTILPWLHELNAYDKASGMEDREHWPKIYRHVDLDVEGDPQKIRNRAPYLGLIAVGAAIAATRSPKAALTWTAIHVPMLMNMGGFINAEAHTGQKKGFWNRTKVLLGIEQPVPDEKGEFAADILTGNEAVMFGEPRHQYHHEHPGNPYIAGDTLRRDPPGWLIKQLVRVGLAETPGGVPEDK